ncbi:hypothetical protein J7K93_00605 [bacterium]|nr:hypothetical protein [bacterium]
MHFPDLTITDIFSYDVPGNSEKEIVLIGKYSGKSIVLILGRNLKVLAYEDEIRAYTRFFNSKLQVKPYLTGMSDNNFYLLGFKKQPLHFLPFAGAWKEFGMGVLFTILGIVLLLLVLRPRYRLNDMKSIFNTLYHNEATGYFLVDMKGMFKTVNYLVP